jgi:hypothetical protein
LPIFNDWRTHRTADVFIEASDQKDLNHATARGLKDVAPTQMFMDGRHPTAGPKDRTKAEQP